MGSRFHLGLMYHRLNRFDKALKCFSGVLEKMSEKDKTVYIARGLVYQDMGNHQFAINDFNQAIKLDENYAEAYYRRGISQLKSRRYNESI
jgi:tetratricopeptide (TPR) repeat protein